MIRLEDKNREYKRFRPSVSEKLQLANNGLQWVLSSNVSAVGVSGRDLVIRFHNGSLYLYPDKASLYEPLLNSNSKGHFVWERLRKTNASFVKIGSLPFKDDAQVTDEDILELVDKEGVEVLNRLLQLGVFVPNIAGKELLGILPSL